MDAGQLAALIAAAFFAAGVCAAVFVLARLARLIEAATSLVTGYQAAADDVLVRTRAVVERADAQLARTGALAEGVDEVAASMSELSQQVSAVAGTAKLIAAGLGVPVLRLAAAGHGVRHALAVRWSGQARLSVPGPARRSGPEPVRAPTIGQGRHSGLRALPDGGRSGSEYPQPASRMDATRARRETWRERAERVRAARERVQQ